ncbi:MAG: tetratricopeptide repeat protein, partial [Planctomycetes bacterium]|nr:tetratricopeptide repeat protein [Planctomycetota bacterium]
MKLEKEKIAFIVVLLLVGWLGWSEFSTDRTKGQRKSRGRAGDVEELDLTTLSAAELQLDRSTWDFSGRNVFRQPSELSPLPPLTLPVPPRTPLPVAPPATIPGPNPFHRLSTVTVPETIAGVRLPVRESSELFAESDAEGEADEEVEGSDTSEEQDPNDPVTVDEEVDDHGADPKAQPSRKILGLRERLQEEARARIEKQEKERMQARALQERRRTLDKLHWLSGETWYGHIDNESTRKKDAPGFDRYELKLRIDALRTDASLDARGLQDALADREMEIDFRRFDDKTGRLETRQQKMSPQNIGAIEFGESAINAFELAKRKTPPAAWQRHLDLARDLLLAEETGRAKRHLKWLVDEGHVQREVLAALAEAARRDFDFELETKTVKQGLAKFPDDPSLLAAQADILGRMGLDGLAEKTLERALELAPRSPIVNGLFGEIILESKPTVRGEHERAIDHLERARSTRIDDPVLKRRVDLASAEAELAVGRFAAARRRFEDLLLIHADDLDAKLGVAAVSYAEGKAAIARKAYEEVLAADPYLGRAWYGLGLSAMATGDWLVARDALLDAIASDPFVAARAQCALGWLYERIGARSESQAAYATAQEADPSDPEVLYWYGRSLMAAGDYQRAFEVHSRATEKMPGQFDLLVALAE